VRICGFCESGRESILEVAGVGMCQVCYEKVIQKDVCWDESCPKDEILRALRRRKVI
jgi:hypothetical protein